MTDQAARAEPPATDIDPAGSGTAATWSPADNPYAIAVSESQWWRHAVRLVVLRIQDGDDHRASFSSRQIDARQLVFALRQMLVAEDLEQAALTELGMSPVVGEALARARDQFETALPGIKNMRDGLMHFDQWSRGLGHGPQRDRRRAGEVAREVARAFWGFAYDPVAGTVSLGPYTIDVDRADQAAAALDRAIYAAAREVDRRDVTVLRGRVVNALDHAELAHGSPGDVVIVSPGHDLRIWLSLDIRAERSTAPTEVERLADAVSAALASEQLRLVSWADDGSDGVIDRLARGEPLQVVPSGGRP